MAQFFVTTVMKNKDTVFQFHLDTNEANTIEELADLLEDGKVVIGERFHRRNPEEGRSKIGVTRQMVGMIQMSLPYSPAST